MGDWQAIQLLVEQVQDCQQWIDSGQDDAAERLEQAQESLYSQLRPLLHRIIRRLVRNSDDAEDILQEVLILVVGKLRNYDRRRAPFRYWVERVTVYTVYQYLRVQSNYPVIPEANLLDSSAEEEEDLVSPMESKPDPALTPDAIIIYREQLRLILECAHASLDEKAYTVWYESLLKGTSHEQIAFLMNQREDWVRQTLHRARLKVAAAIVLHPAILSNEEIEAAVHRCQKSKDIKDHLSEAELALLKQLLTTHPRQPPSRHQMKLFRQACLKILSKSEISGGNLSKPL